MVLFSTLARYSKEQQQGASSTSASASIPTILQLYATPSNPLIHQHQSSSSTDAPPAAVSKHAVLTYQAIEVDLHKENEEADEDVLFGVKKSSNNNNNKLSNSNNLRPDLGLWHCRVDSQATTTSLDASPSLVDSLLTTMIPSVNTMTTTTTTTTTTPVVNWPICWTVDLSAPALVEPSMSRLSQTLIRYLVSSNASTAAAFLETDSKAPTTTSLKQLQATTFGLAPNDAADKKAPDAAAEDGTEPEEDRRICLMIAALLPRQPKKSSASSSSGGDQADWAATTYEEQQAQALVLYHLRRYAAAVNAILVFVQADAKPKKESSSLLLPSITKTQLWQLWQDLALGKEVWKKEVAVSTSEEDPTTADPAETVVTPEEVAPAIYGPGQYHDDLIETVLLRNANCPGHWDAAKDSLWVALPAPAEGVAESTTTASSGTTKFGDDDWLSQLRDSVAGADPKAAAAAAAGSPPSKSAATGADGVKSPEQDTGVASYFESLLKKP